MKTKWKLTLAVVGVVSLIAAVVVWKKGPSDKTKKELTLTLERAGHETLKTAKRIKTASDAFLQVLRGKHCILTKPYEAYAYIAPDEEKVVCIISKDGKSVKALVYPKAVERLM